MDEIKANYIRDSALKRLKEKYPEGRYGKIKSEVFGYMVHIGKNGNTTIYYCEYQWKTDGTEEIY